MMIKKDSKSDKSRSPMKRTRKSFKKMIEDILLKEKIKLIREVMDKRREDTETPKTEIGDIYDIASSERERELSLILGNRDREKLSEIEDALEKLEDGTYGLCEECGEPISEGRLLAMPFAKVCVDCKSKNERASTFKKRYEEHPLINIADRLDFEEEDEK